MSVPFDSKGQFTTDMLEVHVMRPNVFRVFDEHHPNTGMVKIYEIKTNNQNISMFPIAGSLMKAWRIETSAKTLQPFKYYFERTEAGHFNLVIGGR